MTRGDVLANAGPQPISWFVNRCGASLYSWQALVVASRRVNNREILQGGTKSIGKHNQVLAESGPGRRVLDARDCPKCMSSARQQLSDRHLAAAFEIPLLLGFPIS